jgi:hypothetical protein
LGLVIGAKDMLLATELAANSAIYVQVLQPDAQTALEWGLTLANSSNRESMGVRNAVFDAGHYGTDLLNLIVVEDAAALGKAKLADLCRMLVPQGSVALGNSPASFAAEAKALGMDAQAAGGFPAVYRKPFKPEEWKPCDSLKWRAGPRAQLSSGWASVTAGDGKFFYRERMEIPGTLDTSSSQLFARDAYNGRVLWSIADAGRQAGLPGLGHGQAAVGPGALGTQRPEYPEPCGGRGPAPRAWRVRVPRLPDRRRKGAMESGGYLPLDV